MITLRYFASLREALHQNSEELELPGHIHTLQDLKLHLSLRGDVWQQQLNNGNTLSAVNQELASDNTAINDGDEIAFFPPLTGG